MPFESKYTLCWNCANATGGCSWADELKPVKGWIATPQTRHRLESYTVHQCPEFKRDAYYFGLRKLKEIENGNTSDDHAVNPGLVYGM